MCCCDGVLIRLYLAEMEAGEPMARTLSLALPQSGEGTGEIGFRRLRAGLSALLGCPLPRLGEGKGEGLLP
jgi:hypothetical protein